MASVGFDVSGVGGTSGGISDIGDTSTGNPPGSEF